jgi:dTDP-4-amino-4,6-dideoxy-D-galactose acyltransferase
MVKQKNQGKSMEYQILGWDSDFFGFKVAIITEKFLGLNQVVKILHDLRNKNVKLVYWPSFQKYNPIKTRDAYGYLVDIKITFVLDLQNHDFVNFNSFDNVEKYIPSLPITDIENLAIQSGEFSRFASDPRIPREKFIELYKLWINRSIHKEIAKEVLVIREDCQIVGFVTLGEKDGRGDIGLIGVDSKSRGKNYGKNLVEAAQNWFVKNDYEFAQVVTQENNIPACNLYRKCGFTIEKVEFFYHFWL